MTIEEAIQKAVENKYKRLVYTNTIPPLLLGGKTQEKMFLDKDFWIALGKSLGWNSLFTEYLEEEEIGRIIAPNEWLDKWHEFIHHLSRGKTAEDYFLSLE